MLWWRVDEVCGWLGWLGVGDYSIGACEKPAQRVTVRSAIARTHGDQGRSCVRTVVGAERPHRRRSRVLAKLRRRRYYLVVAGALASGAGVAIWLGSSGQDSLESLSLNLGADLIGTILAVFLIGPIIERAELRRDSVLERFDHSKFIRQVAAARHRVFILELWTDLLQGGYTRHFLDALREALQQRVEVRMLLLSPYARAAEQRADDLRRQTNVVENIMDNLRTLHQLRRDLPERQRDNMEVRVYKALPPVQMY